MAQIGARGGQIRGQNALNRQQSAGSDESSSSGGQSAVLEQTPPQGMPILPPRDQA
jgi:hypothetical protein